MPAWVGTSGWSYAHWENVLYPQGMAPAARLGRYTSAFNTVELNASFYRWPTQAAFESWHRRLPAGFRMSVKAPRGLTHGRRLREPEAWIDRIARSWAALGDHAAHVLVQLPPDQGRDDARLHWFLRHCAGRFPVAVELRHPSWVDPAVFALLSATGASYVVTSGAGMPCVLRATAQVVYIRLHGPDQHHLYAGSYPEADLQWWAARIREWLDSGHQVLAYFNNDGDGNAVRNAWRLRDLLGDQAA